MRIWLVNCYAVFNHLHTLFAESYQGYHEERLISTLFRNYNKLARPVEKEEDSVLCKFGLNLQQIIEVVRTVCRDITYLLIFCLV